MFTKEYIIKKLAENIRVERVRRKISQEHLAEQADITQQHLYRIENEKVSPTIHVVVNIALALGVDLNYLLPLK